MSKRDWTTSPNLITLTTSQLIVNTTGGTYVMFDQEINKHVLSIITIE